MYPTIMRLTHCTCTIVFLARQRERLENVSAVELVERERTLPGVRRAVQECRGCDLWRNATQAVFGEGPVSAQVMLVGEQPGDKEDVAGHPFVGPAGRVLDEALDEAGIDRDQVYVTNAVKHFKWKARGKRRIHDKPNAAELAACRPWLDAELRFVAPRVLVPLGATAAQALLGRSFRVTQRRGEPLEGTGLADYVVATVHPSSILRAPDEEARRQGRLDLVADLAVVGELLARVAQEH
ncbi:MAG TPA: UdgX family uracil-DNA binding protein [Gaiellaceae bacterium]